MNVLSLFNGFGGAYLAFEKANVRVNKLYVSEIDKHAMQGADAINPNNINLGSVIDVDVSKLDKIDILVGGSPCQSFSFAGKRKGMSTTCELKITTLEQYLELKENNFEFEGQSYLFWEYMRILKDIQKYNPDVLFFLENVVMTKDWEYILSQAIGIKPVLINSALVSAQNRKRLYWSNIKTTTEGLFADIVQDIEQPTDKGILLKDILEDEVDEKYYLSDDIVGRFTPNYFIWDGYDLDNKAFYENGKSGTLDTVANRAKTIIGCDYRTDEGFRDRKNGKNGTLAARAREDESCGQLVKERKIIKYDIETTVKVRKNKVDIKGLQSLLKSHKNNTIKKIADNLKVEKTKVEHWFRDDKSFAIPDADIWIDLKKELEIKTTEFDNQVMEFIEKPNEFEKSNRVYDTNGLAPTLTCASGNEKIFVPEATEKGYCEIEAGECVDLENINSKTRRGRKMEEKSNTLMASTTQFHKYEGDLKIRRLTPKECFRLQTVPERHIETILNSGVSNSQLYKMCGNGWTIDVIAHFFKEVNNVDAQQQTLF
ncbi:MAG: DNA cytosine methyltransferase [Colwellia sp.]|nr:DNA cytosine methyltransferase [Colwellia sp.]